MKIAQLTLWFKPRRVIGAVLCCAVLASLFPLPLVRSVAQGKDLSQPFPCMHRACGCRNAAQCWKKCCCFNTREKLAWARTHRVTPPESVLIAAEQETSTASPHSRCCLNREHPETSTTTAEDALLAASTADEHSTSDEQPATSTPRVQATTVDYAVGVLVDECQGRRWGWSWIAWSTDLAPSLANLPRRTPEVWLPPQSQAATVRVDAPPSPPPRELA